MSLKPLSPADVRTALRSGALLVDIRSADEHARERIAGARNLPFDRIDELAAEGRVVIFHCRTGMRTSGNAARLANAAGGAEAFVLEGGIDGWRGAGEPTIVDRRQPIELMRQVQIAAGSLILAGVLLGTFVAPAFYGLSAFVGGGLVFAGTTGWCGMANLLRLMPWNRTATA